MTPIPAMQAAATALEWTIKKIDAEICTHEETYRGGAIWTICRGCQRMWADDRGGFTPYREPDELVAAREALSLLRAALDAGEPQPVAIELLVNAYGNAERAHASAVYTNAPAEIIVARQRAVFDAHAALLAASPVAAAPQGDAMPVVAFLLGEGPLDGVWFGEMHPTERGPFWWRKHLRAALSSPTLNEQGKRG